jgi:hypothetical protein
MPAKPDLPKHYSITITMNTVAMSEDEAMERISNNINYMLGFEWPHIVTITEACEEDAINYGIEEDSIKHYTLMAWEDWYKSIRPQEDNNA